MTETDPQIAAAAATQAAGERAAAQHVAYAEKMQQTIIGSAEAVEQPSTSDDTAVTPWPS